MNIDQMPDEVHFDMRYHIEHLKLEPFWDGIALNLVQFNFLTADFYEIEKVNATMHGTVSLVNVAGNKRIVCIRMGPGVNVNLKALSR